MDRITAKILADARFNSVKAAAAAQSDAEVVDAIHDSGLLADYAYSEVSAALQVWTLTGDTEDTAEEVAFYHEHGQSHPSE